MKAVLCALCVLVGIGLYCSPCRAQTIEQMQRADQMLEQERQLRDRLEEEKIFAGEIEVEGVTLLGQDEVVEIISPFHKHWLTKKDIQRLLDSVKTAYSRKGYETGKLDVSYQVKKNTKLVVTVKEYSLKPR